MCEIECSQRAHVASFLHIRIEVCIMCKNVYILCVRKGLVGAAVYFTVFFKYDL